MMTSEPASAVPEPTDIKPKSTRKRNRVPVACSVCRKRKVKCDRTRPQCDVCKRYNVSHLCFYQEPSWGQTNFALAQDNASGPSAARSAAKPAAPGHAAANAEAGKSQARQPKSGVFSNNIMNILNHTPTIQAPDVAPRFGDHRDPMPFSYRNINQPQSSERSTAHFSGADPTLPPIRLQVGANAPAPDAQRLLFDSFNGASNSVSPAPPQADPAVFPRYQQPLPPPQPAFPVPTPSAPEEPSPAIQSELEAMKQKIKEIEASITLSKTFAASHPAADAVAQQPPSASPTAHQPADPAAFRPGSVSNSEASFRSPASISAASASSATSIAQAEPYIGPGEVIDFYKGYISVHVRQSRAMNHGPLSWLSMLKRDPFSKILWTKVIENKKRKKMFPHNIMKRKRDDEDDEEDEDANADSNADADGHAKSSEGASGPTCGEKKHGHKRKHKSHAILGKEVGEMGFKKGHDKMFAQKLMEQEGIVDIQPYKKGKMREVAQMMDTVALGVDTKASTEMLLLRDLETVLPTKKVIWLATDRFFKYFYPFCPYLDEEMYLEELSKIIGPRSYVEEPVKTIAMEKRLDFATIGIMLVTIRLGFLTVTCNSEKYHEQGYSADDLFLLDNPVKREVAGMAHSCLNQFNLLRKSSINIFQLALLMRAYHGYAPEEGDGPDGGDSLVFGGMLTQMGISLGLNRDPLDFNISDKMVNLWRKLWSALVISDARQANTLGNTPSIHPESYDTKQPVFDGATYANISNLDLEEVSVNLMNKHVLWSLKARELSNLILNLKNPPKLRAIVEQLKELESFVKSEFHDLNTILSAPTNTHLERVTKAKQIIGYLEMQSIIQSTYYHVFLYYEDRRDANAAYFYLKKNLSIVVEIVSMFVELLKELPKYVGVGFDTVVTPKAEMAMHRCLQIQIALIIRAHHHKCLATLHDSLSTEHGKVLDDMVSVLFKNVEKYLTGLSQLSHRYYYAWRMSKAQSFILDILRKSASNFFELNKDQRIYVYANPDEKFAAPTYNIFHSLSLEETKYILDHVDSGKFLQSVKAKCSHTAKNGRVPAEELVDTPAASSGSSAEDETKLDEAVNNRDVDSIWLEMMNSWMTSAKKTHQTNGLLDFSEDMNSFTAVGFIPQTDDLRNQSEINFDHLFEFDNLMMLNEAYGASDASFNPA